MVEYLFRGSLLIDDALIQEQHAVRDLIREAEFVRHDHHRHAFTGEFSHDGQHLADHLGIEGARGLVEEENLRFHGQRAGDRDALLLAAGEPRGEFVDLVFQANAREQAVRRLTGLIFRQPSELHGRERDILRDGEMREQVEMLENHSHPAPDAVDIAVRNLLAVNQHLTGIRCFEPVQAAEEGALPGARGPDDTYFLAAGDGDGEVVKDDLPAVLLTEMSDFDHFGEASVPSS